MLPYLARLLNLGTKTFFEEEDGDDDDDDNDDDDDLTGIPLSGSYLFTILFKLKPITLQPYKPISFSGPGSGSDDSKN